MSEYSVPLKKKNTKIGYTAWKLMNLFLVRLYWIGWSYPQSVILPFCRIAHLADPEDIDQVPDGGHSEDEVLHVIQTVNLYINVIILALKEALYWNQMDLYMKIISGLLGWTGRMEMLKLTSRIMFTETGKTSAINISHGIVIEDSFLSTKLKM